jgi:hypothetical protein
MKIYQNNFNPLGLILDYLKPLSGNYLTLEVVNHIKDYLFMGGVVCESPEEVVACMGFLEELGLIKILEHKENKTTYYEVFTTYGK